MRSVIGHLSDNTVIIQLVCGHKAEETIQVQIVT